MHLIIVYNFYIKSLFLNKHDFLIDILRPNSTFSTIFTEIVNVVKIKNLFLKTFTTFTLSINYLNIVVSVKRSIQLLLLF
jgi:hypothetical protein